MDNSYYNNLVRGSIRPEIQLEALTHKSEVEKRGSRVIVSDEQFIMGYNNYYKERLQFNRDDTTRGVGFLMGMFGIAANGYAIYALAAKQMIASGHGTAAVATLVGGTVVACAVEGVFIIDAVEKSHNKAAYKKHVLPMLSNTL